MWGGGREGEVWTGWKKKEVKTWPCPCTQSLRGMGAIIALPKNKRGKMTVEDTVTKSSSGQIGGPALWRVSHKRQTTQPPQPPAPLPYPRDTAAASRSALSPIRFPLSARPHREEGWRGLKCLSESTQPYPGVCGSSEALKQWISMQTSSNTHRQTNIETK